jgi:hypothetical protein
MKPDVIRPKVPMQTITEETKQRLKGLTLHERMNMRTRLKRIYCQQPAMYLMTAYINQFIYVASGQCQQESLRYRREVMREYVPAQ